MATKKITELVEITAAANDDVLPIVDISTDITNKIKVENLPISNDVQTALNGKEDLANKSTSVTTDQASNTKYPSVKAVYDWAVGLFATLSQLATKQDTLVSGTNIKTVNSTSLLGSGDIPIPIVNPSGVAGSIQFSDGSAFASDATNLFWDNTNKRLGVGFNTPTARLQVRGSGSTSATTALLVQNSGSSNLIEIKDNGECNIGGNTTIGRASINLSGSFSGSLNFTTINFANWNGVTYARMTGLDALSGTFIFGGTSINASAKVQFDSTTQGFLPPRMTTTQKNAISLPASGLQVYDTTLNQMSYYNGSSWINF
jgi:hypothetical protein